MTERLSLSPITVWLSAFLSRVPRHCRLFAQTVTAVLDSAMQVLAAEKHACTCVQTTVKGSGSAHLCSCAEMAKGSEGTWARHREPCYVLQLHVDPLVLSIHIHPPSTLCQTLEMQVMKTWS